MTDQKRQYRGRPGETRTFTLGALQDGTLFFSQPRGVAALVVSDENGACAAERKRTGLVPVVILSGRETGQLVAWPAGERVEVDTPTDGGSRG